MAMEIVWDIVEGSGVREKDGLIEIVRPIMVTGMPQNCSDGKNPAALLQALSAPGMPLRGTAHPTLLSAFLEERNVRSIAAADAVMVDLIYAQRVLGDEDHTASSIWSLTDATQGAYVSTYATADGSKAIQIWYKAGGKLTGAELTDPSGPKAGSAVRNASVHRYRTHRVITASSILRGTDWDDWKADVRGAAGKINADVWGSEARGTWLCLGPTTRYIDPRRRIVHVQIGFVQDPNGHYPIAAWFNERGQHPADCNTEAELRGGLFGYGTPPDENSIRSVNGLTIASVQQETAFTPLFAFTPTL